MRLLTVPNWSFGRDRDLLHKFREALETFGLQVHYLQSDVDHNRTVSAFSGESAAVFQALMELSELAFERIDLNHHIGVHPRIGALDVCPFVLDDEKDFYRAKAEVESFAAAFSARFEVPAFLYERSELGRHEDKLPELRRGGFGSLLKRQLEPDFGPARAHPRLGVTVMGVRDFLVAMNVDLEGDDPVVAKNIAKQIRDLRAEGDERFLGVRALGFPLASVNKSQVSLNLTLPDLTPIDPIVEFIVEEARRQGRKFSRTELIGVIRRRDLLAGERVRPDARQVVG